MGLFINNTAHSMSENGMFVDRGGTTHNAQDAATTQPGFETSYTPHYYTLTVNQTLMDASDIENLINSQPVVYSEIVNFTGYKVVGEALWGRGESFHVIGAMLSDNQIGAQYPGDGSMVENSVFVGDSDNIGNPWAQGSYNADSSQTRSRFYPWFLFFLIHLFHLFPPINFHVMIKLNNK